MPIYSGVNPITDAKLGSTDLTKIYLGDKLVWERSSPSPVPSGYTAHDSIEFYDPNETTDTFSNAFADAHIALGGNSYPYHIEYDCMIFNDVKNPQRINWDSNIVGYDLFGNAHSAYGNGIANIIAIGKNSNMSDNQIVQMTKCFNASSQKVLITWNNNHVIGDVPPFNTRFTFDYHPNGGTNWFNDTISGHWDESNYQPMANSGISPIRINLCIGNTDDFTGGLTYENTLNRSPTAHVRYYGVKMYVDDALVSQLIPVTRDSDNAIGFYDIIRDIFCESHTGHGGTVKVND